MDLAYRHEDFSNSFSVESVNMSDETRIFRLQVVKKNQCKNYFRFFQKPAAFHVTMNSSVCGNEDGIKIVHIKDFLMMAW